MFWDISIYRYIVSKNVTPIIFTKNNSGISKYNL